MPVVDTPTRAAVEAARVKILSIEDEFYPPLLRFIHDPPELLYARGNLEVLRQPQLAVVGSRKASPAALRLTTDLCGQVVAAGLHICSGLALGIDGAAHRGALGAGGSTVGVMATGIDRVYPARHRHLVKDMLQAGCLVTEFPPGTPPRRGNFPQRNRIISGMSLGVLVVEAALPSGSLITARTALEQGREVFAAPWSALHKGGEGCLYLLADGARLVRSIDDILEELGPLYQLQLELSPPESALEEEHNPLLALIGYEAVTTDELVLNSGLDVNEVMAGLSGLELEGRITRVPGGYIRS
jgi:DNA processing protein